MTSPMDTHEGLLREAEEHLGFLVNLPGVHPHRIARIRAALTAPAQGARNPLDAAWEGVNALGGTGSTAEELAFIYGIERALSVIEELGGMDPLARPSLSSTQSATPGAPEIDEARDILQAIFPMYRMVLEEHAGASDDVNLDWKIDLGTVRRASKFIIPGGSGPLPSSLPARGADEEAVAALARAMDWQTRYEARSDEIERLQSANADLCKERDAALRSPAPHAEVRGALQEALAGLQYIAPAIPVLRTMLMTADLKLGAAKAGEMDASNREAIEKLKAVLAAIAPQSPERGEASESQAKATEGNAGMAGVGESRPVRRSTAGTGLRVGEASADLPATSEFMDVTAGETAPNSTSSVTRPAGRDLGICLDCGVNDGDDHADHCSVSRPERGAPDA